MIISSVTSLEWLGKVNYIQVTSPYTGKTKIAIEYVQHRFRIFFDLYKHVSQTETIPEDKDSEEGYIFAHTTN
jgi:hypothetical protein